MWPSHSNGATASEIEMPALLLLGLGVGDGRAVLHPADPVDGAGPGSSASASVVLPLPPWPTRATLRILSVGHALHVAGSPRVSRCRAPSIAGDAEGRRPRRPSGRRRRMLSTGGRAPPPAESHGSRTAAGNVVGHVRRPVPGAHREGREAGRRHPPAHAAHARPAHDGRSGARRGRRDHHRLRATCWPGSSWSCWPHCPTCSTAPWPRPPAPPASGAPSSTRSPTASPTCCCSAAWRWYFAADDRGVLAMLPVAVMGLSTLISYQRAKAESLGPRGQGRAHGAGRADHPAVPRPAVPGPARARSCG